MLGATAVAGLPAFAVDAPSELRVACQQWSCATYVQREGKDWFSDLDASLKALRDAGFSGYEPAFASVDEVANLAPRLPAQKLWCSSLYFGPTLHEPEAAEKGIADELAVARAAAPLGIQIVVSNPSPIRWGGDENKSDAQLRLQAESLNRLGAGLRELGVSLAYHNHDAEMRASAREFHHMMLGTDPANVKLCLDAHWVFRGAGNSAVALFDIVRLYADRVVELHLRQSQDGTWSEVFGPGDIDYRRLADVFLGRGLRPHLVLEQGPEAGTPQTMAAMEALKRSLAYVEDVFQGFAG